MAAVAAMSPYHFSRQFRKSFGVPPMRFVAQMRVDRVKMLLCQTDLALSEIAIETGYSSQSHMTSAFKVATGETPKSYRQKKLA